MLDLVPSGCTFIKRKNIEISEELRKKILQNVGYNAFAYPAAFLKMDLISDSGCCALNQQMWMAIALADESYARNNWYFALLDAFRDFIERGDSPRKAYLNLLDVSCTAEYLHNNLFFPEIKNSFINDSLSQLDDPNAFIFAQGRCCETALFTQLGTYYEKNHKKIMISNGFFDTTKAHVELSGGFIPVEFSDATIYDDYDLNLIGKQNPFKGGIDIEQTENYLTENADNVVLILMTLTNNSRAAQPVSMKNLKEVKQLCIKYNKPLWIDASRVNENAMFIKLYEEGYQNKSIPEILKEIFSMCDGFHISMKKILCNMGGFMSIRTDSDILRKMFPGLGFRIKTTQILNYGNDSYGALSGRDLAAATIGLYECVDESYLKSRLSGTMYVGRKLSEKGVPVILPPGGHAIYLDINKMFKDRKWNDFVGCGLVAYMIQKYGIRGCELGYQAWELDKYVDLHQKMPERLPPNFVRFAFPANVYHKEHFDYLIESIIELNSEKNKIPNAEIKRRRDSALRHFVVGFELSQQKNREDREEIINLEKLDLEK